MLNVLIINLALNCINEMRFYNCTSSLIWQDFNADIYTKPIKKMQLNTSWTSRLDGWIKSA